jgi:hypothetical protein
MERETGIEPATNSLEGCDSTTELLPPSRSRTRLSTCARSSRFGGASPPYFFNRLHVQPAARSNSSATAARAEARLPPNNDRRPSTRSIFPLAQGTIRSPLRWPAMSERRAESNGGEGRVRTSVARRRQVYSLLRLTALPPPRIHLVLRQGTTALDLSTCIL